MAAITVVDEFEDLRRSADEVKIDEGTELGARLGLVGRGVAYMIAGAVAFQIAWSGAAADAGAGALRAVADEPVGRGLLVALAVALAGGALWHLGEALWGGRDELHPRRRMWKRLLSAIKAVTYAGLAAGTLWFVLGDPGTVAAPRSPVLVGSAAAVLFVAAVWMVSRGLSRDDPKRLDTDEMGRIRRGAIDLVGMVGLTARGAAVALLGYLLLRASIGDDPAQAADLEDTVRSFVAEPYGRWIVTAIAVGLACYGLYSWIEARYRRL
jgi:hypothetical protein